jgi:heme A synthase
MAESLISFLISVCLLVLVIYLVVHVLTVVLEWPIPAKVIQILWVIVALIVILWLVQILGAGGRMPRLSW